MFFQLQAQNLKQAISDKEAQFLHSHNVTLLKRAEVTRRRTWAPSTTLSREPVQTNQKSSLDVPPFHLRTTDSSKTSSNQEQHIGEDEFFMPGLKLLFGNNYFNQSLILLNYFRRRVQSRSNIKPRTPGH